MMLSQDLLDSTLHERYFRYYAATDSTNDDALAWLRAGAAEGAVVIADEQRRGRGRLGRMWHTPPGVALALSVILKPDLAHVNRVSMLGGVIVAELCEYLGAAQVGIKYPNDVQIQGRKVCGILPEAAWHNEQLLGVVLGMGINVRVAFDADLAQRAINLEAAVGRTLERIELIRYLLERIDHWRPQLEQDALFQAWRRRLTTIGQTVVVGDVRGVAQAVDSDGALLIMTANGIERVLAGDVMTLDAE